MQTKRFNFVVDKETEQEFHKIMEQLDTTNKNQTFIRLVSSFRRLYFESQLFRQLMKEFRVHENLWEQREEIESEIADVL